MKGKNITVISLPSISTILTIIFTILKLCKVITWHWVFVFMPLIVSAGLFILALILFIIVGLFLYEED